jgi:hypothetical protein
MAESGVKQIVKAGVLKLRLLAHAFLRDVH